MQVKNSHSPTTKINIPQGLKENSLLEADRIGISLQDFIRMLLSMYFAKFEAEPKLDSECGVKSRPTSVFNQKKRYKL